MPTDPGKRQQVGAALDERMRATASAQVELAALANTAEEMPPTPAEAETVIVGSLETLAKQLTVMLDGAKQAGKRFIEIVGAEGAERIRHDCTKVLEAFDALRPSLSLPGAARGDQAAAEMSEGLARISQLDE